MDPADQQFAGDFDVGAVPQRTRDDRLNHGKNIFDTVIEFIDDGGQPPLETDPNLNFPAEPQVIIGNISEQTANDAGQRKTYRGYHRG
ncbi:MAG TPA: hypothetical protein PLV87_16535, partial [Opitutaceae bacterium]|nr:hypothetical protein [Opitutaceae bacterium]